MKINAPTAIGLATVAVVIAAVVIWKSVAPANYPDPVTPKDYGAGMIQPATK